MKLYLFLLLFRSFKDLTVIARGELMKVQFPDNDDLNFSDEFSKNFSLNSENKELEELMNFFRLYYFSILKLKNYFLEVLYWY